jgi:hypothetical protein
MITNYLSPQSFIVSIDRLPHVEFFTQKVTIPDVSGSPQQTNTPLGLIYDSPSQLSYSDLDITFIVDEDMKNYLEILNWLEGMGSPNNQDQYKKLKESDEGVQSDITIVINNNHKNPNKQFIFKDCFPTAISSISLDVTSSDTTYAEVTATFRYTNFTVASHE